jgi:hypothetical protein
MLKKILIPTIALLMLAGTVQACSCMGWPTPAEQYDGSDVVFKGYCEQWTVFGNRAYARFNVHASWKGTVGTSILIETEAFESMCGYPFIVGETYLVYGTDDWVDLGDYYTHLCTRTVPMEWANEDLDYLGPPVTVPNEDWTWGEIKAAY